MKSWLIGFIDGDGDGSVKRGCSRSTSQVEIVAHAAWGNLLCRISTALSLGRVVLAGNGTGVEYVRWRITRHDDVAALARHGVSHRLPMMPRKLGTVDIEYVTRSAGADSVRDRLGQGYSPHEVSQALGRSAQSVYNLWRRSPAFEYVRPPDRYEVIRRLLSEHEDPHAVAALLNEPIATVRRQWLKHPSRKAQRDRALASDPRARLRASVTTEERKQMIREGRLSLTDIARCTGVSQGAVSHLKARMAAAGEL